MESSHLTEDTVVNFCQMLSTHPCRVSLGLYIKMTKEGLRLFCYTDDEMDGEEGLSFDGDLPEDFILNVCTLNIPKYYCEKISVRKSHLTSNFVEKLCGVLKMSTIDLQSLEMEFSYLTEDAVMNFCQMLSTNPSPKPLCLNIQMSKEGLSLSCYSDDEMDGGEGLSFEGDLPEDFIWNVCTLIIPKYKCKKISVRNSHLTSNFMEKLCGVLKMSTIDLQSLEREFSYLTEDAVMNFCQMLSTNPSPKPLCLNIQMSKEGLRLFCYTDDRFIEENRLSFEGDLPEDFIWNVCTLIIPKYNCPSISVCNSHLTSNFIEKLCGVLKMSTTDLRFLVLTDTHLTDSCAESLSSGLDAFSSLEYLDLSNNSFTDSSVPNIIHIMLKCTNLMYFKLEGNQFSPDGKKNLNVKEELQRCGCLLTVHDYSGTVSDWSRSLEDQQEYKRRLTLWI